METVKVTTVPSKAQNLISPAIWSPAVGDIDLVSLKPFDVFSGAILR